MWGVKMSRQHVNLLRWCNAVVARERLGGEDSWRTSCCLLPHGHDGPHADWTAWLGVKEPDFSSPGASR